MRTRPITVFAVALALLAAVAPVARAQDKFPADVQKVYDDYRADGVIDVCDHTQATLESTRDSIKPEFDRDYPDFREAVEAGIDKHKDGGCGGDSSSGSSGGGGTSPPAATATPGAGTAPISPPASTATPESGKLPEASPAPKATVPPEDAIPPQTGTPAPTAAPPAAAVPAATPTPAPQVVHAGHRSLTLPIVLLVIALLGALALALSWLLAKRNPRVRHAWREAAFRTRGTWADFSDWLRLGR
jgi:hypothetical protein